MAGQGTVAVELLSQLPEGLDLVIVPVGGGGLIGGIAAVLKAVAPGCTVVGAQPAASDVMRQSVAAGVIVDAPSDDTLSDATAGAAVRGVQAASRGAHAGGGRTRRGACMHLTRTRDALHVCR